MTSGKGTGEGAPRRCVECGVELKPGLKYCDFCGRKVPSLASLPGSIAPPGRAARDTAGRLLGGLAAVGLAVGVLVSVGNRLREPAAPAPAAAPAPGSKRLASATCEEAVRRQVRAPFRVISFRSSLVAETSGGFVVTGSIELQSAAGDVQVKRYFCKAHRDAQKGFVSDEARID
jgi:hypothetical protein